jgi:membrane-bound lytic murein transglycosylase B
MSPIRRTSLLLGFLLFILAPVRPAAAIEQDFSNWLQGVRQEALGQGISAATLDRAFAGIAPIPRVLELDSRQPETTLTFAEYIDRVVNPGRRQAAHDRYIENRALLGEIGKRFGVQPRFIVALWGIETDFGRVTGNYQVIPALATLAYDGRRASFFRRELMNALTIVDRRHIDPQRMMGSWAGAMGQSQFMPSTFLAFAVSYRGDAAPDIWNRREDVFASIANYLASSGWHADEGWGDAVSVPAGVSPADSAGAGKRPIGEWAALGLKRLDGRPLPAGVQLAALIAPGGADGPNLLVYDNFRALLKWNNSSFFATAVGYLADGLQ